MLMDVKRCVDARIGFLDEYFTVPANIQEEVESVIKRITTLGEESANATEFEEKFASTGLSDEFMSITTKCTQKPRGMTAEEKQRSAEIMSGMKNEFAKHALESALDSARIDMESELIANRRKQMIEAGVMDDYTRTRNAIEDAGIVGRFLGGMFKKNKK